MTFCAKCGTQLEQNVRFCNKCGADSAAGATPPATGAPAAPKQPNPAAGEAAGFIKQFFSNPSTAIKEGNPGIALALIFAALYPLTQFFLRWAVYWRNATDSAQAQVAWDGRTVSMIRETILDRLNFGAGFGHTLLHWLVALAILVIVPLIIVKALGHRDAFDFSKFFTLIAVSTAFISVLTLIRALITLMSSSWGSHLGSGMGSTMAFGLVALGSLALVGIAIKRVFGVSTERAIYVTAITAVVFFTYLQFGSAQVIEALQS